jgi:hypothetical protein
MTLHIDGTTTSGELDPSGSSPWAIFDDERQTWLVAGIRWRWMARLRLVFMKVFA